MMIMTLASSEEQVQSGFVMNKSCGLISGNKITLRCDCPREKDVGSRKHAHSKDEDSEDERQAEETNRKRVARSKKL